MIVGCGIQSSGLSIHEADRLPEVGLVFMTGDLDQGCRFLARRICFDLDEEQLFIYDDGLSFQIQTAELKGHSLCHILLGRFEYFAFNDERVALDQELRAVGEV